MSTLRTAALSALALAAALAAGQAHAASATLSVGLVLRAPGAVQAEMGDSGTVNAAGRMRADGLQVDAVERAIAQAPKLERTSDRLPDGSQLHSIQY